MNRSSKLKKRNRVRTPQLPKLYTKLARWWPVLSSPLNYKEEATRFHEIIKKHCRNVKTVLELGCGGGNNASYLKKYYQMTLSDISPAMLRVSKRLNPECKYIRGDMRSLRLGREFDCVFIHDAIMYMTSEKDLMKAIETAYRHCRPKGILLVVPDIFKENFKTKTSHGGNNVGKVALRYLEWDYDPDPTDQTFVTDFAYLMRDGRGKVKIEYDRHILGLFSRRQWLRIFKSVGFRTKIVPVDHSELKPGSYQALVGIKE